MDEAQEHELLALGLGGIGGRGGYKAGKKLPINVGVETLRLAMSLDEAVGLVDRVVGDGRRVQDWTGEQLTWMPIRGIKNPVVVTLTLQADGQDTLASVRAVALEGLIKQRTGQKTAAGVAQALSADATETG